MDTTITIAGFCSGVGMLECGCQADSNHNACCVRERSMADNQPIQSHAAPQSNLMLKRPGPPPHAPRDNDRLQARQRVNVEVRTGRRPRPDSLPCADCGHLGSDVRHEYDHYLGYASEHHLDVEPVCIRCHVKRDSLRAKQTHCIHGHAFTPENTIRAVNGTRHCRECRRAHDRKRDRGAGYWKEYRAKRKAKSNG